MAATLTQNTYGKGNVRVFKVDRSAKQQRVKDLNVQCMLQGDFTSSYYDGDNSKVIPTDTIKNTVYIKAREHAIHSIEEFGIFVVKHFLSMYTHVTHVTVDITEFLWDRMKVGPNNTPHDYSFVRNTEKRLTKVRGGRNGRVHVDSGIEDLTVLKTTGSGFSNFRKDKYTTLKETDDRILCTNVTSRWTFGNTEADFNAVYSGVRQTVLDVFATEFSKAVQETVWLIGKQVIAKFADIDEIFFRLPNIHIFLHDLEPFGMKNPNEVYRPFADPNGVLEGTITRTKNKL